MFKQECYKIFSRKSIYFALLAIVLLMIFANSRPLDWVMTDQVYDELYQTLGGPVTEEKEAFVREKMRVEDAGEKQQVDPAASEVYFHVAVSGMNLAELEDRKSELENELTSLQEASYDYRLAAKELDMLEELNNPYGFYKTQAWNGMMDLIEPFFGVVFIALLLLVGLSPVFADEHSQKTTGLLLATRHGRKKIVTAKLMASMTYVLLMFTTLHITNFLIQFISYGGIHGWDAPMQSLLTFPADYSFSPYSWDVWQFYIVILIVQLLGSMAFAIVVLLFSALTKNTLLTLFLSGSVLGLPFVMRQVGFTEGFIESLNQLSYLEFIRVERLFDHFQAFDVFGYPVMYSSLLFTLFTFFSLLLVGIVYYRMKHLQENN